MSASSGRILQGVLSLAWNEQAVVSITIKLHFISYIPILFSILALSAFILFFKRYISFA